MELSRLLMIDLSGSSLTPDERAFLVERRPGGVCLFGRNVVDRYQLADYVDELRSLAGDDLLVAVDQEGGGVLRIEDVPGPPAAMALGAADDTALTRSVAAATGRGLAALGIDVDFAPVADVNANPANPVIADRSFGADPHLVARHVVAFVQGLQQEGVAATLKHFPGHGDTDTDSHLALPNLSLDLTALDARELIPFRAGIAAGAAAVMSAHILLPAFDPEHPATLSRALAHELLREHLDFDGVLFSDALNMRAIADRYGVPEAAVRAWQAGVDMPVHVGPLSEHGTVLDALAHAVEEGRLEPSALRRSAARVSRLASRYPGHTQPEAAWREGDEALLDRAARRGLVLLGALPPLRPGMRVALVAADEVRSSAASQLRARPAQRLAEALQRAGVSVTRIGYAVATGGPEGRAATVTLADPSAAGAAADTAAGVTAAAGPVAGVTAAADRVAGLWADDAALIEPALLEAMRAAAGAADTTLFVSTSRTPMAEPEIALGKAVAGFAPRFVHVAMWNPYHAAVLPGPALIGFGFGERTAAALAAALLGAEVTGSAPVPLRTLPT